MNKDSVELESYELEFLPATVRILIDPDDTQIEKKIGSIYVPDSAQKIEYATTGTVIAIGPEVQTLAPGDRVVWTKYSGCTYEYKKKEYMVMNEEDILCIFKSREGGD